MKDGQFSLDDAIIEIVTGGTNDPESVLTALRTKYDSHWRAAALMAYEDDLVKARVRLIHHRIRRDLEAELADGHRGEVAVEPSVFILGTGWVVRSALTAAQCLRRADYLEAGARRITEKAEMWRDLGQRIHASGARTLGEYESQPARSTAPPTPTVGAPARATAHPTPTLKAPARARSAVKAVRDE